MERKQNGSPDLTPRRGIAGDFTRAHEGSLKTAEELQEFMKNFRGKNPQEVLGLVAQSGLVQGVILSTIGTICLFAAFTVGPFVWGKVFPPQPKKAAQARSASKESTAAPGSAAVVTPGVAAPGAPPSGAPSNAQQALEKLGETETRTSDPGKNPLDNALDNLLDDTK